MPLPPGKPSGYPRLTKSLFTVTFLFLYPDRCIASLCDRIRKICEDRGGEEPPISRRTEVGQVLDIWTRKLREMGLRFEWDFDIPGPPPTEQEADNLVEIGKLLHIDDAVREFYGN